MENMTYQITAYTAVYNHETGEVEQKLSPVTVTEEAVQEETKEV